MLIKLERDESNLKADAEKKLALISCFVGKTHHPPSNRREESYQHLLKKVDSPNINLSEAELRMLTEDGNLGLLNRLNYVFELNKLRQFANSHVRIPIDSIEGKSLADIQTAKMINSMSRIYRYNPIDKCAEFIHSEVNVEQAVTRAVRLYMELRYNKEKDKKSRYAPEGRFTRPLDFSAVSGGSYAYS